jgi:serine/threonine protein kinase
MYNDLYNEEDTTINLKDIKNLKYYKIEFKKSKKYNKIEFLNNIIKTNINTNYNVIDKIGNGEFGSVYMLIDNENKYYALKIVLFNKDKIKKSKKSMDMLHYEYNIYNYLWTYNIENASKMMVNQNNIFKYKNEEYAYIILEYYNESLTKKLENKITLEEKLKITKELISSIKELHKCNYLHNDLKPDNIMFNEIQKLKLIDFGLCTRYINCMGEHIIQKEMGMIGNERYASIDTLKKLSTSRRSDIESIGYILLYMVDPKNDTFKYRTIEENIMKKKELFDQTSIIYNNLPIFLKKYFKEIKKYKYHNKPNYEYLISILE